MLAVGGGTLNNAGWLNNTASGTLEIVSRVDNSGSRENHGALYNFGGLFNNASGTLKNTGRVSNEGTLDSYGSLLSSGSINNSGELYNEHSGTIDNIGRINNDGRLDNKGTLSYSDRLTNTGTLNNYGDLRSMDLTNSGTLNNDNGSILTGGGLISAGTVNNTDTGIITNVGTLTNTGTVHDDGTINGKGTYIQTAGQTINSGSMTQSEVRINGGSLGGTGTIASSVTIGSGGSVNPGTSTGTMTIIGSFISSGSLLFEIGGLDAGRFDVLDINGSAIFNGGSIAFDFISGFHAAAGDYWDFLLADSITGWDTSSFTFSGLETGLGGEFISLAGGERLMITGGGDAGSRTDHIRPHGRRRTGPPGLGEAQEGILTIRGIHQKPRQRCAGFFYARCRAIEATFSEGRSSWMRMIEPKHAMV